MSSASTCAHPNLPQPAPAPAKQLLLTNLASELSCDVDEIPNYLFSLSIQPRAQSAPPKTGPASPIQKAADYDIEFLKLLQLLVKVNSNMWARAQPREVREQLDGIVAERVSAQDGAQGPAWVTAEDLEVAVERDLQRRVDEGDDMDAAIARAKGIPGALSKDWEWGLANPVDPMAQVYGPLFRSLLEVIARAKQDLTIWRRDAWDCIERSEGKLGEKTRQKLMTEWVVRHDRCVRVRRELRGCYVLMLEKFRKARGQGDVAKLLAEYP